MKKFTVDQVVKMGICYPKEEIYRLFKLLGVRKAGIKEALMLLARNEIPVRDLGWLITVNKVVDLSHFESAFKHAFKNQLDEEQESSLSYIVSPCQPAAIKVGCVNFLLAQLIRKCGVTKTIAAFEAEEGTGS